MEQKIISLAIVMTLTPVLLLLAAGIAVILVPIIRKSRKKKICTQPVTVKCIRIEYPPDGDRATCNPIWEGTVDGRTIEYSYGNIYYGGVRAEEGEVRTFYVNPGHPEEYYDPVDKTGRRISGIVGGFLIFMAALILISMFVPES